MNRPTTREGVSLRVLLIGSLLLAPLAASAAVGNSSGDTGGFTNRIIVKYRASAPGVAAAAAQVRGTDLPAARFGVQLNRLRVTALGSQVLQVDRRMSLDEATRLALDIAASDSNVEYAEPDRMMQKLLTPNDTRYNEQWHYFEATAGINAPAAWDKATGSGVVVGIVDTGYRPHADLSGQILQGYDFISDTFVSNDGDGRDSDASDPGDAINAGECGGGQPTQFEASSWHGTHVAGTIAAKTNNASGVAGIAFNAKIVPARVLASAAVIHPTSPTPSSGCRAAACRECPPTPTGEGDQHLARWQRRLRQHHAERHQLGPLARHLGDRRGGQQQCQCGQLLAGQLLGRGDCRLVNRSGGRSYFSNFGTSVEVAAPGGDMRSSDANGILSTLNAGTTSPGADSYAFYQGTSMATPHVVGVVALMLSVKPTLTPDQVTSILQSTARPFPATCSQCGSGIVDALAAVNAAIGGTTPPPPGTNEAEPDNSRATAQAIATANTTVNGAMSSSSDTDYFSVSLPAGRTLTATLTPNSSSDYDLYIYNSSGTQLASSIRGTGQVDAASVTNTGSGASVRYVRVVYYAGGTGSTNGKYTLNLNW